MPWCEAILSEQATDAESVSEDFVGWFGTSDGIAQHDEFQYGDRVAKVVLGGRVGGENGQSW